VRRDDWDREAAEGVTDDHDVVIARDRPLDDRGVRSDARFRVVTGEVWRDRVEPTPLQFGHEPFPAPRPVVCAVDEGDCRHAAGLYGLGPRLASVAVGGLPSGMRAWRVHGFGEPHETFVLEDIPEPTPTDLAGLTMGLGGWEPAGDGRRR
jgi:hypothetical protein